MNTKITICVADDHPVFLAGLGSILSKEKDLTIVSSAENGAQALELILSMNPQIAVLDIEMPEMNGFEVLTAIRKEGSTTKVIFLTMYHDSVLVKKAERLGASGFILKENAIREILRCVQAVASGHPYFKTVPVNKLTTNDIRAENQDRRSSVVEILKLLTGKEKEVMVLLGEGKSSREIATSLYISEKTVQNHRSSICKKLELTGRYSLTHFVLENKQLF